MKTKLLSFLLACAVTMTAGVAFADGRELAVKKFQELKTITGAELTSSDLIPVYDLSDNVVKTITATSVAQASLAAVEDTTATNILTAAECGKIITLNSTTEFVTTLPAVTAGCRFTFYVKAAPSGASYTIVTDSSANVILGQVLTVDFSGTTDSDFEATGGDTITFVDAKAVKGDRAMCESDGTNWFCTIQTSVFDAATITGT